MDIRPFHIRYPAGGRISTNLMCGRHPYIFFLQVKIVEYHDVPEHEAVRIFLEFKRIESAIKALVDLNGRFFGGREVQASFYDVEKFTNGVLR